MDRREQAWGRKRVARVAGTLLMDIQAAFNNVSRALLVKRMKELGIEADLI